MGSGLCGACSAICCVGWVQSASKLSNSCVLCVCVSLQPAVGGRLGDHQATSGGGESGDLGVGVGGHHQVVEVRVVIWVWVWGGSSSGSGGESGDLGVGVGGHHQVVEVRVVIWVWVWGVIIR